MRVFKAYLNNKWIFLFLIFFSIIIRIGSFFPSVIDHDESTYIVIGSQLLEGNHYLIDFFDTKPIGIFLIYGLLSFLSGGSIFLIRLFSAILIGVTGYFIYRLANTASREKRVGLIASVLFIISISLFKNHGISVNAEHFLIPFTLFSILLIWNNQGDLLKVAAAGLLLGCGFIIKYVISADAFVIGCLLLWKIWSSEKRFSLSQLIQPIVLLFSFFIPLGIVYCYYISIGQEDVFIRYTFEITSQYPTRDKVWFDYVLYVLDFFARFLPLTLLAFWAIREVSQRDRSWQFFLIFWLLSVMIITLLPGKNRPHYQIQAIPPLVLLASTWFSSYRKKQAFLRSIPIRKVVKTAVIFVSIFSISSVFYYVKKHDGPREVADYLQSILKDDEIVYTGNYHQIVNHLIDQKPITPFVHSTLLYYESHIAALEIDLEQEANNILSKNPEYILLIDYEPRNVLMKKIFNQYTPIDTLLGYVLVMSPKDKKID